MISKVMKIKNPRNSDYIRQFSIWIIYAIVNEPLKQSYPQFLV